MRIDCIERQRKSVKNRRSTKSRLGWCKQEAVVFPDRWRKLLTLVRGSGCNCKTRRISSVLSVYCHDTPAGEHLLLPSSAAAVVAAVVSVAEPRSIAHPADFLRGSRTRLVRGFCRRSPQFHWTLRKCLTFPTPAQSLQGFLPIPMHTWQGYKQTSPLSAIARVWKSLLVFCPYWIHLNWWRVGNLYDLLTIHEKCRALCRDVPRSWSWLGKGIHGLVFIK